MIMSNRTVSYRSSAVSTSASLSKCIRDERYEDLKALLQRVAKRKERENTGANSSLNRRHPYCHPLWESYSRGWTPMHVAAIASPTMPLEWWNWILQQQQQQQQQQQHDDDSSFSSQCASRSEDTSNLWTKRNSHGQTVVELFFRTALDPLPWCKNSLKEKAGRLKAAILRILAERKGHENGHIANDKNHLYTRNGSYSGEVENEGMLEKLRELIMVAGDFNEQESETMEDEDVAVVLRFWNKLTALLSTPSNHQNFRHYIVNILAGLPWCPELVGRLAIALFPAQVKGTAFDCEKASGEAALSLPLHRCIRSFRGSGVPRGMLQILCDAYPFAASVPDPVSNGRLPLHVALASQHSWEESLKHIFAPHPSAVTVEDPLTGLPAFCMACDALSPIQNHQIEQTAKDIGDRSLCWHYLSKTERARALKEALVLLECQKLTSMYEVLRRDPAVVDLNSTGKRCWSGRTQNKGVYRTESD